MSECPDDCACPECVDDAAAMRDHCIRVEQRTVSVRSIDEWLAERPWLLEPDAFGD